MAKTFGEVIVILSLTLQQSKFNIYQINSRGSNYSSKRWNKELWECSVLTLLHCDIPSQQGVLRVQNENGSIR